MEIYKALEETFSGKDTKKINEAKNKLNEICKEYYNYQNKLIGPEGIHKLKEEIGKYEIFLLKQLTLQIKIILIKII